jgi:hypothetical protein
MNIKRLLIDKTAKADNAGSWSKLLLDIQIAFDAITSRINSRQPASPTTGTWQAGDTVYNSAPTTGGYIGWVCTMAGTPGNWKGFGVIA